MPENSTVSAAAESAADSGADATGAPPEVASIYHILVRINRTLRASGGPGSLSAGAAAALWTIINSSPTRLSTLAERESVTAPTMSRIVAALEDHGYVERTTDPDDGRARLFSATPEGVALISNAQTRKARVLTKAIDSLAPADQTTVHRGFALLADALAAT